VFSGSCDDGLVPVHRVALTGFGSTAELYEEARPGYPDKAVAWLIDQLRIGPGSRVVDLAAGTGKLTRMLMDSRATVIAIEPIEAMRALLANTSPGSLAVGGEAEALPLRSGSVDALTIAQAFHWIDTPPTHAELARVIRPGGRLGIVWNARDRGVPWVDAVWSIMDRVEKHAPWRNHEAISEAGRQLPGFSPFRSERFVLDHVITPDLLIARLASVSHMAVLAEGARQAVLREVRQILATHPDTRERQALQVAYRTDCFVADRVGGGKVG